MNALSCLFDVLLLVGSIMFSLFVAWIKFADHDLRASSKGRDSAIIIAIVDQVWTNNKAP